MNRLALAAALCSAAALAGCAADRSARGTTESHAGDVPSLNGYTGHQDPPAQDVNGAGPRD